MRAVFYYSSVICVLVGCNPYAEILAPHAEPGGTVGVTVDQGALHTLPGLVTAKAEPLSISAQNAFISVGIEAGLDGTGATALTVLAAANATITLPITDVGRSQLQVYVDGDGCRATSGTIVLATDNDGKVGGSFLAAGVRSSDATVACALTGTLAVVPVTKE